jgi:hypothetical protein
MLLLQQDSCKQLLQQQLQYKRLKWLVTTLHPVPAVFALPRFLRRLRRSR